tara:strand:- start:1184 stop:2233 length:1050 start_codon:yes stop_codon:yes gene_type:complete
MKVAIITGSNGLIGSESVKFFSKSFDKIIGIDNDYRKFFFGKTASTNWVKKHLLNNVANYEHFDVDVCDKNSIKRIFSKYNKDTKLIIHTAAQPSHDWAAKNPILDFEVNTYGALNLLEATREYSKNAVFIFTSTNKVYGDRPNQFNFKETKTRYEILEKKYLSGFDEELSIDNSKHSVFGCSKLSADIYVQEYGKYFNMNTGVFRGGCLTGPMHSGAELHGFLSYLVKCNLQKEKYKIFGYKGKQVRDNIHSSDLISMFNFYYKNPSKGEIFNCGGGIKNNCSIIEAINIIESITNIKMKYKILKNNRIGDHIWYITDYSKFKKKYPSWDQKYTLKETLAEIIENIHL